MDTSEKVARLAGTLEKLAHAFALMGGNLSEISTIAYDVANDADRNTTLGAHAVDLAATIAALMETIAHAGELTRQAADIATTVAVELRPGERVAS